MKTYRSSAPNINQWQNKLFQLSLKSADDGLWKFPWRWRRVALFSLGRNCSISFWCRRKTLLFLSPYTRRERYLLMSHISNKAAFHHPPPPLSGWSPPSFQWLRPTSFHVVKIPAFKAGCASLLHCDSEENVSWSEGGWGGCAAPGVLQVSKVQRSSLYHFHRPQTPVGNQMKTAAPDVDWRKAHHG